MNKYLPGYPPQLLAPVSQLIAQGRQVASGDSQRRQMRADS
jgi:hypothetical protein